MTNPVMLAGTPATGFPACCVQRQQSVSHLHNAVLFLLSFITLAGASGKGTHSFTLRSAGLSADFMRGT